MTLAQRIGYFVFITAMVGTLILCGMGVAGVPLPKWVLALAIVL